MAERILQRQLEKMNLSENEIPQSLEDWQSLLKAVKITYNDYEKQATFNQNTLDVAMKEMDRLNEQILISAEKEIANQEEKLSTVVEAVPSIVAWTNFQSEILGFNNKLKEILNLTESQIKLNNFLNIGWSDVDDKIKYLLSTEQIEVNFDIDYIKESEMRVFKFVFKKLIHANIVILVGIDITEELKKQKELEEARANSVGSSRMALLGEMASGIAHEINNPLAIIDGLANQINRILPLENPDKIKEHVDKILKMVIRIKKIISGLRNFARDGSHDPFLNVQFNSILEDTLELSREKLKSHNIQLIIKDFPKDLSIPCRATQISQVLLNLISNARDAIEKQAIKWIELDVARQGQFVIISVTDSGNGISKEVAAKIFEPFFTTKQVGHGTGLGLSISFGIIKSHKGEIFIDSNCPNTRFVVKLPLIK